jgi:mannose-6-phosphate isomerase-like protein (cupin superfamily)
MKVVELNEVVGRRYPAGRRTKNLVGGSSSIQAAGFSMGHVALEPNGGQVPWHNHEQEEVYFVLEGVGEFCLGDDIHTIRAGQTIFVPSGVFHQLTNLGPAPLSFLYIYSPAGDVSHWRDELAGTLPKAGVDAPPLPNGAQPQHTDPPSDAEMTV